MMNFFLETRQKNVHSAHVLLYKWFIEDGYLIDMVFSAVVLIVNSFVALGTLKPIHRFAIHEMYVRKVSSYLYLLSDMKYPTIQTQVIQLWLTRFPTFN